LGLLFYSAAFYIAHHQNKRCNNVVSLFIIAITNGVLTARLNLQKNLIVSKERKSKAFYNLLKDLSFGKNLNDVTGRSVQQIFKVFGAESVVFYSSTGKIK
jgi:K+-sensing histidine kinase KdpD